MATKIVEQCQVTPSPGAPAEHLLKLLHFNMTYLPISPMRNLFFYRLQCSESHFFDAIIPSLKNSLSLSLKHFTPLAAKVVIPHNNSGDNNRMLVFRYVAGEDYVPLTISISSADFENLTAYHSREAHELLDLTPHQLPEDSSTVKYSLTSFQVTLFPDKGVCIGVTSQHLICDGISLLGFLRTWASINRSNGDASPDLLDCLPTYDRDAVADGDRLATEFWEAMKVFPTLITSLPTAPRVRATFVLSKAGIKTLESRAYTDHKRRVSPFVVACAHLWTCLARSAAASGEEVADDEAEYFSTSGDCRGRLNPPLPDTYFGNCMTIGIAESTHGKLRGRDGFSSAAEAIAEAIERMFDGERGIMESSSKSLLRFLELVGKRMLVVNGSPRLDFYATTDYGWGRPVKFEPLLDHNAGVVFIGKSRECRGGMEIGAMMPEPQMDAFAAFFSDGLPTQKLWCKM